MTFLWSVLGFILAISLLVTVHEYGHFWVARRCGVKITRFSLGFGKVLWSRCDKQGTEFVLSAIPLGGYVKMLDERQEIVPEHLKPYAFNYKPLWQRACIVGAGPIANFLFAIVLYAGVFMMGIPNVKPVIASVIPHSIAEVAHLPTGKEIIAVDGESVEDWQTIHMLLATKVGQEKLMLTLQDPSSQQKRTYELDLRHWQFEPEKQSVLTSLGIEPVRTKVMMQLSKVTENSPAERAGLKVGDKIFHPNGEDYAWQAFVEQIRKGEPIQLQVVRNAQPFLVQLTPEKVQLTPEKNEQGDYVVGVAPILNEVLPEYKETLTYPLWQSVRKGVEKTVQVSYLTLKVLGKLLTGQMSVKNLSGPISIAKGAGVMVQVGLVYYLAFLALISVNLGIMNLLPLPVLDGGHLVFLGFEAIRGKPLSEKTQQFAYQIGASLLFILTVFALLNDVFHL